MNPLSIDEKIATKSKLELLENVIRLGRKTFFEVGSALAEIMEERLYIEKGFGSFAEYCDSVWGFKKSYAYQLIRSAEVVTELPKSVSTIVENLNPGQIREIAKIPVEDRELTIEIAILKAKSDGRKMTAKDISAAAEPMVATQCKKYIPGPVPVQKSVATVVVEARSIEVQLRELWNRATPHERDSFLKWISARETTLVCPPSSFKGQTV